MMKTLWDKVRCILHSPRAADRFSQAVSKPTRTGCPPNAVLEKAPFLKTFYENGLKSGRKRDIVSAKNVRSYMCGSPRNQCP
jgi:hypothetical protein